ncbi:MAG: hypothetical protein J6K71_01225 [Clostridia bacterium]|nr:hypothetical protein [Clostridia bacterium]
MEIKKPLSRKESIQKYEKEIFECLTDPVFLSLNYKILVTKIIKYASKLLDTDFLDKRFEKLPEGIEATYMPFDNVVKFSKSCLDNPGGLEEPLQKLLNLFVSATHEFTHAFDYTDNNFSGKNRDFLFGAEALIHFANLFEGQTKKDLSDFADAVYWLSRSEKVARQGAFTLLERFIKKYEIYAEENVPHLANAKKQAEKHYNFFSQKQYLNGKALPKISPSNREYYQSYAVLRQMQTFLEELKLDECQKTSYAYASLHKHKKSYNQALLDFSEKLLKEDSFGFKTEEEFYRIVWTQMVPETYNPKVLANFASYAEKFNLENAQKCCLHLEDLAHQRQQEKQKRKIIEKQK